MYTIPCEVATPGWQLSDRLEELTLFAEVVLPPRFEATAGDRPSTGARVRPSLQRTAIPDNGDIRGLSREAPRVEASPCGNAEMLLLDRPVSLMITFRRVNIVH
jgi:hypothetical protein